MSVTNPLELTRLAAAIVAANRTGRTPILRAQPTASAGTLTMSRAIRHATLNVIATAISAPARATTSHRSGEAFPKTEKTVVKITGSGFHVGPPVVTRSRWAISLPHTSHAHGS